MSLCWSCSFLFRRLFFSGSGGTETSAVPGGPEVFVPPSVSWTHSGTAIRTPSCSATSRLFSGIFGDCCFGLVAGRFWYFFSPWPSGCLFVSGFWFFLLRAISRCFLLLCFVLGFPASCCVVLLHLASFLS